MTDLVELLRTTPTVRTFDSIGRAYDYPKHLPQQAADEIERLRKALDWIIDNPSAHPANMVKVAQHARSKGIAQWQSRSHPFLKRSCLRECGLASSDQQAANVTLTQLLLLAPSADG